MLLAYSALLPVLEAVGGLKFIVLDYKVVDDFISLLFELLRPNDCAAILLLSLAVDEALGVNDELCP